MATETLSYNAEGSEFASSPATVYELITRIETMVQEGRMRGMGRSMLKSSEVLGLIEDLKRELPKITSLSDQVLMKKEEMISEAKRFVETSRRQAQSEAQKIRQQAEEERSVIIGQAQNKSREILDQSAVVKSARDEGDKIIEESKEESEKVMVRAKREAKTIVDSAEDRAYRQIMETDEYSRKLLMKLEERLSQTIMQIRQGVDAVNESMEEREKEYTQRINQMSMNGMNRK